MQDFILGAITVIVLALIAGAVYGYRWLKAKFDAIEDEMSDMAGAICDITIEEWDGSDPDGGLPMDEPEEDDNANDNTVTHLTTRKKA